MVKTHKYHHTRSYAHTHAHTQRDRQTAPLPVELAVCSGLHGERRSQHKRGGEFVCLLLVVEGGGGTAAGNICERKKTATWIFRGLTQVEIPVKERKPMYSCLSDVLKIR